MKHYTLFVILLFILNNASAQELFKVSGHIVDSTNHSIISANIWLVTDRDSLFTMSDENGKFIFSNFQSGKFKLNISLIGYELKTYEYNFDNNVFPIDLPPITLKIKTNLLKEVVIKGKPTSPVVLKGDTIEYQISQYHLRENSVVEDLLRRLPGLKLDERGNISYLGKNISKIRINGQDFPVDNIQMLTRLLETDLLDKVQLIEDYGPLSNLTGRKISSAIPVLNLQTKNTLKETSQINSIIGVGSSDKHNTSLTGIRLTPKQQLILVGSSNNISSNIGNPNNRSIMFAWSKSYEKLIIRANTSWEYSSNKLLTENKSESFNNEGKLVNESLTDNNSKDISKGIFITGEYKSQNKDHINFMLRSRVSESTNINEAILNQTGIEVSNQKLSSNNQNNTPVIEGNISYSRPVTKNGGIFSLSNTTNVTYNKNILQNYNNILFYNNSGESIDSNYNQRLIRNANTLYENLKLSYINSINRNSNLEITYNYSLSSLKNIVSSFEILNDGKLNSIDSLSENYKYLTSQHEPGINYKYNNSNTGIEFLIGTKFLLYRLKSISTKNSTNIIKGTLPLPFLKLQYKINKSSLLLASYNLQIGLPSYQQIQPIPDYSNIQYPIVGNPNLKPSQTHSISTEYRMIGSKTLFFNLGANINTNKIAINTRIIQDSSGFTKQETKFLNINGDYDLSLNYGLSNQINDGKILLSYDGSYSYKNEPLIISNTKQNNNNLILNQSIKLSIYEKWLDFSSSFDYTFNHIVFKSPEINITNYHTWNFSFNTKIFIYQNWSLGLSGSKQINQGISSNISSNPLTINSSVEKSILYKKLTFSLQGFNLKNEVSNINQSTYGNTIIQTKTNLLGRYFLFSVLVNFKKVKTQ